MVGGLVQQQHIRPCHQGLGQGDALFCTSGEGAYDGLRIQMQAMQRLFDALLPVPGVVGFNHRLQRIQIKPIRSGQVLVSDGNHMLQAL